MNIFDITLTDRDSYFCERWLARWKYIISCLTREDMTEEVLIKLIKYEAVTRKREDVLMRLTGRYNKLRRLREWQELREFTYDKKGNREKNRTAISS